MLRAYLTSLAVVIVAVLATGCGAENGPAGTAVEPLAGRTAGDQQNNFRNVGETASEAELLPFSATPPADLAAPLALHPEPQAPSVDEHLAGVPEGRAVRLAEQPRAGVVRASESKSRDRYAQIVENEFKAVRESPLSTFSIDVDTASYAKTRMYLQQRNVLPPPDAVRIEELVNYFDYDYSPPSGDAPFAVHMEVARAPWHSEHLLARVGIKGRVMENRPTSNLVFLIDVSGSMNRPSKLGLVKQGLRMLTTQLNDEDRVSIVVYAGAAGLVLPATQGDNRHVILDAVERLTAGGSTNGGEGVRLAYDVARRNFVKGGVNRVLLCTDGDFNVGTTNTGDLVRMAAGHAQEGIFLSVLGFGMGNHNDAMLEQLSNQANGNYAFIDSDREARKVLLDQLDSTLVTIAKDVKVQIEFNPAHVDSYRLIGYENRQLAARDFNDDKKDAGEIGAGHTVTALYELVLADGSEEAGEGGVDPLKYQTPRSLAEAADSDDLLNLKLRFKRPNQDRSELTVFPIKNAPQRFGEASRDFQFAAAVAEFGMLLRNSKHRGDASYAEVLEIASAARGRDQYGYRSEFLQVVNMARQIVEPDAAAAAPFVPPYVTYHVPVQHAKQPAFSTHDLQATFRVLFIAVVGAWTLMVLIGVVVIAWALVSRQSADPWAAHDRPVGKVVQPPTV